MRTIRLFLYAVVGVLFGSWAVLSHAETINATQTNTAVAGQAINNRFYSGDQTKACNTFGGSAYHVVNGQCTNIQYPSIYYAIMGSAPSCGGDGNPVQGNCTVYTCPDSSYTLTMGTPPTCTRPDCQPGQTRDPTTGQCVVPCPMYPGDANTPMAQPAGCSCPSGTKWVGGGGCRKTCGAWNAGDDVPGGPYEFPGDALEGCINGCGTQQKIGTYWKGKNGVIWSNATYTGWACAGNGAGTASTADGQPKPNSPALDPTKIKPPVCGATDGVMTSSSGTVACVPAGTPDVNKPVVKKQTQTENFQDGTQKQTTTTTTQDPGTGATDTQTTTTTTGLPGGGAGQAGTPGTSTSSGTSGTTQNGDGKGKDGGECDPTLQFCGGPGTSGLYKKKDKTVQSVLQSFSDGIKNGAIGKAASGFFQVTIPNGACPQWSVDVAYLNVHLDISQYFCTPTALQLMDMAGWVILAVASFVAFRWAIL